ncbi:hypothetical protein [Polyangium mundeleinium]|uniref:CD-NTase-associated protein 12/Pycsar effector protein TIR domain-containing protein n=1 Tax=Polyangium mundeleinium TaxID=2995306 RepID=A0ABT5END1_9BACT|nr:hypothetical protein [Polyangium mundeleinium]MDC0743256.1 hypothetical protein [Polyangium mundeleinium]
MSNERSRITIFWSWQFDAEPAVNKHFIGDCLEKAAKIVSKESAIIISVDRDTSGVGGTPAIADTILAKIRSSDVFVWDATFMTLKPKPSPNPNVLFELGYAFAILGEGRLIGVMNTAGIPEKTPLPFDLNHRRWPIRYELWPSTPKIAGRRISKWNPPKQDKKAVQKKLVAGLVTALKQALKEPKGFALRADVDLEAAKALWKNIDSAYLRDWHERQAADPKWETRENIEKFSTYVRISERPENRFQNEELAHLHEEFVASLNAYLATSANEMVSHATRQGTYLLITKTRHDLDHHAYSASYGRQLDIMLVAVKRVWSAWNSYVARLRCSYPEVTSSDHQPT